MPTSDERDPNAPKEPLTALDFYAQARRKEEEEAAKPDNAADAQTQSSSELYEMEFNNNLSDAEKSTWYKLARMDRIRYKKEMSTYEPPVDSSSGCRLLLMGRFFPFDSEGISFADTTLTIKEAQNSSHIGEDGGTGLNVWDGAMLLARYIEKVPNIVKNKRVIELGSGCGVVGIAAAISGCKEVVMTDLSYALPLMRENVESNEAAWKDKEVVVSCKECDWFQTPPADELLSGDNNKADVLLVADCVWLSSLIAPLLQTLKLYANDSTEVFITYQQRGKEAHDMFLEGIHELFDVVDVDTLKAADLEKPDVFHLFHCKRKIS
jgi:predicted nicotinamide N-methyase